MAEVKNNFLKSKMNKDLDDRLVPQGEYRHGQNISVAKSEGQDVGAIENILGNTAVASFLPADEVFGVEIIGQFMDVKNDRIIVFMTNYVDTSPDTLSNFAPHEVYNAIGVYNILGGSNRIIVSGRFLNFSKTHEIYGVNMIDDLLFWTDNRNQPRKINVSSAFDNTSYYTIEDTISVSKYYPHDTIDLITEEIISATLTNPGSGYHQIPTGQNNLSTTGGTGSGLTVNILTTNLGAIVTFEINNIGIGYQNGDVINIVPVGHSLGGQITLTTAPNSTMRDVVSEFLPDGITKNPYRQPYGNSDITWKGDPEYLKDKFVRFSYRFKFDDGEYSLIAPFTQTCFIPKQDGYFIGDDDSRTFASTEVEFMQNKVNNITLVINSPIGNWNDLLSTLKVSEIDILYKEAGQNSIKVLDTLNNDYFALIPKNLLTYEYESSKPWKTLSSSEVLRVHDQVPVRALAQEVISNRVIYGNYIDKPTAPSSINYSCDVIYKNTNSKIEYQNQNLKQNRTYQVGIVLSDRYGRQSSVILSTIDDSNVSSQVKGSTIFNKYKSSPFSNYTNGGLFNPSDAWDGDNLRLTFWNSISSGLAGNVPNNITGEPGLYNAITNPLGWYSYKLVIKQTEQDYYNIYFPGILNGYADGEAMSTGATSKEPVCHFALHGDNINKVPRDLSLVGPNQKTFRTGRPSAQEDPSYYQFVGVSGFADPFSEEGERLLKERDRERDLDAGSQITNANVKLSLRLNNAAPDTSGASTLTAINTTTHQAYPGINLDTVVTIGTGVELGLWDAAGKSPFDTAHVFYGYKNNPYIAKTIVSAPITTASQTQTGLVGPHPLSGKFNFYTKFKTSPVGIGVDYVAGSLNIPVEIDLNSPGTYPHGQTGGAGSNFLVNVDEVDSGVTPPTTGAVSSMSIADFGGGWDVLGPSQGASYPAGGIPAIIRGAGNAIQEFVIHYTKTEFKGTMVPSLAVYETQPLKSKLDIYWETSTNGLISELNEAIETGDVTTPEGFAGISGSDITLDAFDESVGDDDDVSGPIFPINNLGSPITGPRTVTLISISNNVSPNPTIWTANSVGVPFTVEMSPAGYPDGFSIKTNKYFMADFNANTVDTFTFRFNVESPSLTWITDGSFINTVLELGPYTLGNLPPYFMYDTEQYGGSGYIARQVAPTPNFNTQTITPGDGSNFLNGETSGAFKDWLKIPWRSGWNEMIIIGIQEL